jgi:tetratricopeptide (TPR) repeat protein
LSSSYSSENRAWSLTFCCRAHLNLARVYIEEGRMNEAAAELDAAGKCDPPAPAWSRIWFTSLVNSANADRKEHIDAVIGDLERLLDPAAQPRDRKFDFTRDYVVWNALANRLFKRRQYEPAGSDARRDYLLRAIKAAETVLSLDAEDVEAHDLLMRCYAELSSDRTPDSPPTLTPDEATGRIATAADPKLPADKRIEACGVLAAGVPGLPAPRLATIREALGKLRPAFHGEADPAVQAALAAALAVLHRESHAIYKPDEVAQANATRIYREKNPIANYAARARVVYPTTPGQREAILKAGELPPVR